MPNCYYYDEQSNHCNCYVNENLNELLEENVNLRVQLANAMVTVRSVDERCAKLRELVLHMYTCMGNVDADGNYECFSCEYEGAECDYDRRLRELGIEVEG